jgi:tripartite-type tricarboxylate transporter receptor subunit TctC
MNGSLNARLVRAFFCLPLLFGAGAVEGADRNSPLRLVVPAAAGGGASLQAAIVADALGRQTGRSFIVDHRSGLDSESGASVVARSAPDGQVLLLATASLAVRAAGAMASAETAVLRGLKPVLLLSTTPLVLAVHPRVPAKTLAELLVLSRAQGGRLQAGAGTAGGLGHLAAAMLLPAAPAARITVFRGGGPAVRTLVDGHLDLMFAAAPVVLPQWVAGRLRMLAVTAPSGHAGLARLPLPGATMSGAVTSQWYGMFAPADTPDSRVRDLQEEMRRALRDEILIARFSELAIEAAGDDAAAFDALLQREIARYAPLVRRAAMVP